MEARLEAAASSLEKAVAPMMERAVAQIETTELGTKPPLATIQDVMTGFEEAQQHVAADMANEVAKQMKTLPTFYNALVESIAYLSKMDDLDVLRIMQALWALAGQPKVKGLKEMRKALRKTNTRALLEGLAALLAANESGPANAKRDPKIDEQWAKAETVPPTKEAEDRLHQERMKEAEEQFAADHQARMKAAEAEFAAERPRHLVEATGEAAVPAEAAAEAEGEDELELCLEENGAADDGSEDSNELLLEENVPSGDGERGVLL